MIINILNIIDNLLLKCEVTIIEGCEFAWQYFEGIPEILIFDNLTPVVDFSGKTLQITIIQSHILQGGKADLDKFLYFCFLQFSKNKSRL